MSSLWEDNQLRLPDEPTEKPGGQEVTFLKKALRGEAELSPKDATFEDSILKDLANPRLSPIQKATRMEDYYAIAETDAQREVAEAYRAFTKAVVNGAKEYHTADLPVFDFTTTQPSTTQKYFVVLTRAQLTTLAKSLARTLDLEK